MADTNLENHYYDPNYGLMYNPENDFFLLDKKHGIDEGAYVSINPKNEEEGIIEIKARNGRPKNTKVTMKKRGEIQTRISPPPFEVKVSNITVIKTVKNNSDEEGDDWDYDYQFTFKMHSTYDLSDTPVTLIHKQNNKERQFNIPTLTNYKEEDVVINLTDQDTSLFEITKTELGANIFNVNIFNTSSIILEDILTDFTVDLSNLNALQKAKYGLQQTTNNVKE